MDTTPRMTRHARDRCVELGISTKRAKRIVQHRSSTYEATRGHGNAGLTCQSTVDPSISVVWDPITNQIITVLPRTASTYVRTRTGAGYTTTLDIRDQQKAATT
jgi:hypothetical protein